MVTGMYAGIFALAAVFLIINVVKRRMKYKVSFGAGGEKDLERYIRAHGNFMETVPLALILIGVAEFNGASLWLVYTMGDLMCLSRLLHYFGLTTGKGYGKLRGWGMLLTFFVYVLGAGAGLCYYVLRVLEHGFF